MRTVLVTGATGNLGRFVVAKLKDSGWEVRATSRHAPEFPADLSTGEGLEQAIDGVEVIVHAASSPVRKTRATDVEGTRRLLEIARRNGVTNFVYISIVGIDRVRAYPYYRVKLQVEDDIRASGLPWTILRATQFHELLPRYFFRALGILGPLFVGRGWKLQPVEVEEVAQRLVELADEPSGMQPDFGGPEVLTWDYMARSWLSAQGSRRPVVSVPVPGSLSRAFRDGLLLCPENREGRVTWDQWLQRNYPSRV